MPIGFRALACALLVCACIAESANAAPVARLHVSVSPKRLGASTTIKFGFTIAEPGGALPPALTVLNVQMPPGMGIDTRGLETCTRKALARGPQGCPASSQVGTGSVLVRVPLGEVIRPERAALSVFNGPRAGGHTTLLFYAAGRLPIATQLVFTGVIAPGPLGPSIKAAIPLIPTLPEAPDASIVELTSTLGTREHTYYRTVGHRRVRFTPKGATLPPRCPPGGFPFPASFHFNDGSTTAASTNVPCSQ
jgi:hypothetical protein